MSLKDVIRILQKKLYDKHDAYLKAKIELKEAEEEYKESFPPCKYCKKKVENPCIITQGQQPLAECKNYEGWRRVKE